MSLVAAWLGLPLLLGLLSLGCGLLLERAAGGQVQGALLLPVGFAAILVVGTFTTATETTAPLTAPLVAGLATAGLAINLPWRRGPFDRWAAAAAVGVFLVFGAPVLLSGDATFAGYIKLDDTASWLGITDHILEDGRSLAGLPPSTYEAMLDYYLSQYGYPVGTFPPLGIGQALIGTDAAWLFQPYLSFLAAMLALSLYCLIARLVESARLAALAAFVAGQAALLYGYALWGGVKELAVAATFALIAALAPTALRQDVSARTLLPAATAAAAMVALLNVGGGVWLAPLLVPVLVAGVRRRGRGIAALTVAFASLVVVLSVPSLLTLGSFLEDISLNSEGGDTGNLSEPLSWLQTFGIWPVGDFRGRPENIAATHILIAVLAAAAVAGLAWAVRRRRWELPLLVGAATLGCVLTIWRGSIWIDAKALAIASPAFVLAAMAGVAWLIRGGRRIEAAVVGAAIAGGVLWSNALAYHDVWLAPRGQLRELESIGSRFSGQGPTLITEPQIYGARHFLREMAPEAPSELRRRQIPLVDGGRLPKGEYADIDRIKLEAALVYRTLVTMHTASASRPPSAYDLAWSGSYYSVWQRPQPPATAILEHLSLGTDMQPAAVPRCGEVVRLARLAARSGGRLAAVRRPPATVAPLSSASFPTDWKVYSGSPDVVYPSGSGALAVSVSVPSSGRYGVWLGGSFRGGLAASIDGRNLEAARHRLGHPGVFTPLGEVRLAAGAHRVVLAYDADDLRPGSGGDPFALGPLVLSRHTDDLPVTYLQPAEARSLCGESLDWVEALAG